jgi:hypothetical protein
MMEFLVACALGSAFIIVFLIIGLAVRWFGDTFGD